ncbi:MAG TPA: hypothetical protein VG838_00075 [Opitutaceae bacterium]|nr:hypothetical protein [Opitutaceae bacterium]
MSRRIFFFVVLFFVIALTLTVRRASSDRGNAELTAVKAPAIERPVAKKPPAPPAASPSSGPAEERIALADALNAPDADIQADLRVLNEIFQAWLTNFPHEGNPVGDNAEITAALAGDNRLRLALIARDHPAINTRGELCDRWGTPFRFHQLSGTRMEIVSAGPDRKFATEDDARLSP